MTRAAPGWLGFRLARALRSEDGLARWSIPPKGALADLTGRSVALVGNARALAEGAAGAEIDAHDLVIRINRAPMPASRSHGRRTDWLALAVRMGAADLARLDPSLTLWMSHKRKRLPWAAVTRRFYLHRKDDIDSLWQRLGAQPRGKAALLGELRRDTTVVSVLQGTRLPDPPGFGAKPEYMLSTTTLLALRGKALSVSVYSMYESADDLAWIKLATARWIEDLQRLNVR